MRIINEVQGSEAWKKERARRFTASEAAAVFGEHKYMSRADLLHQKACQPEQEVSAAQQKVFDRGHEAEAAARPIAEEIIGEELYPISGIHDEDDRLMASMDGLTMLESPGWEHKHINDELRQIESADDLAEHYKIQMDHQFAVSESTERILFMASDGTRDNCVHVWYERDEDRIKRLIAGWDQFEKDLAEYEPPKAKQEATGKAPEDLPAIRVEVSGGVTASNLDEFRDHAMAVLRNINTDLSTDQDFADAEKTVKWCGEVEKKLEAAKDHALGQTASIDELFRTLDSIKEEARQQRLALDKKVKARKQEVRDEIFQAACKELKAHQNELAEELGLTVHWEVVDIAGAMKNKRTVSSLQSAADEAVANGKLAASELASRIRGNLQQLAEHAPDHRFLFNDLDRIATKAPEDFAALVKQRVSEYEQAEKERREREERERAEREERERQQREAAEAEQAKQPESAPSQQEQIAEAHSQSQELYGEDSQFCAKSEGIDLREDDYFHLGEIIGGDELSALRYDENGNEYELTLDVRRKSLKRQDQAA